MSMDHDASRRAEADQKTFFIHREGVHHGSAPVRMVSRGTLVSNPVSATYLLII